MIPLIHPVDLQRYHAAARMIEDDADQAYRTCRAKFGPDIAGALLVMLFRRQLNHKPEQWPPPEDLVDKVNQHLQHLGLTDGV